VHDTEVCDRICVGNIPLESGGARAWRRLFLQHVRNYSKISTSHNVWHIEWEHVPRSSNPADYFEPDVLRIGKIEGDITDIKGFNSALHRFMREHGLSGSEFNFLLSLVDA
jgi:hypothetical protein